MQAKVLINNNPPIKGLAIYGPIDSIINGPWIEFSFFSYSAGTLARGCPPADPDTQLGGCTPSDAGNSVFADAPPWTFTAPSGGVKLTVTDAFYYGPGSDFFQVFDFGNPIGVTSEPWISGYCGNDPDVCVLDPMVSKGTFDLGPGNHSITITIAAPGFNIGAAYFRVDTKEECVTTITNLTATPSVLWPPNHKMIPVKVDVSPQNTCDHVVACQISNITSNESSSNAEWNVTGSLTVDLKAERNGNGNGRVYKLTIQCTDTEESTSSVNGTVTVTVPHDQGRK